MVDTEDVEDFGVIKNASSLQGVVIYGKDGHIVDLSSASIRSEPPAGDQYKKVKNIYWDDVEKKLYLVHED